MAGGYPLLFLFVDGVGLAAATATNPLASAPTPALRRLLGGPLTAEQVGAGDGWQLHAVDAGLGVEGLPQSATGQTALLTGENAPALLGRHATAFPGPQMRDLLLRRSVLLRARAGGHQVTFANAFGPSYFAAVASGRRRHGAMTLATLAAGARLRDGDDLAQGAAATWDVTGDLASQLAGVDITRRTPAEAGAALVGLLADHDLVLYETFLTDLAGHRRFGVTVDDALARVDALLAGILAVLPATATVVLTSDHGNCEDATHKVHTANPVPLLAIGPRVDAFAGATSLLDVAPGVLRALGVAG
jgi:hypothetical protein